MKPEACYRCWPEFNRHCEHCIKLNPVEQEYENMYKRYLSPSHPWFEKYPYEMAPRKYTDCIARMHELINQGFTVKCAYSASSVRGFHNRHIFKIKS